MGGNIPISQDFKNVKTNKKLSDRQYSSEIIKQ